jgi:hypothetical protein
MGIATTACSISRASACHRDGTTAGKTMAAIPAPARRACTEAPKLLRRAPQAWPSNRQSPHSDRTISNQASPPTTRGIQIEGDSVMLESSYSPERPLSLPTLRASLDRPHGSCLARVVSCAAEAANPAGSPHFTTARGAAPCIACTPIPRRGGSAYIACDPIHYDPGSAHNPCKSLHYRGGGACKRCMRFRNKPARRNRNHTPLLPAARACKYRSSIGCLSRDGSS